MEADDIRADARLCASARARATSFAASLSLVSSLSMSSWRPFSRASRSASSSRRNSSARCSRSSLSASSCSFRYCAYCSSRCTFSSMSAAFSFLYRAMRASVSGTSMSFIRLNALRSKADRKCVNRYDRSRGVSNTHLYLRLPLGNHCMIVDQGSLLVVC